MSPLFAAIRRAALLCLPFAAILVAGVTSSTRVAAQYPGGGSGYPGGGSGGSYPGAGWHPLKPDGTPPSGNDLLNTSPLFNSYDWTKLDIDIPNSPTVKYVTGEAQGSTGGVSGPVGAGTTRNIHGTSTIKYQWVPPLNAAGQPDAANFPAPPLFVLGSIGLSGGLTGSDGMSGSGSLADGWGGTLSMTLPCSVSAQGRKVLSASGSPAVFTMSPSASLRLSVTAPGQTGGGGVFLTEFAYPITLSAPNPLTNPLLGDGTNQYVYDNIVPNSITDQGHLFVDGTVLASGANTDDLNWLLIPSSKVDCTFDSGLTQVSWMVNPAGYKWAISPVAGSSLQVMTSNATDPRIQATFPYYDFVFFQLPVHNTDFGNHTETLTVNGSPSQVAHIQTFFLSKASNYPSAYSDYVNSNANASLRFRTPNWYYYYNLVYTAPGKYQPGNAGYTDFTTPYAVHIEDQSYGTVTGLHVFALKPGASLINYAGNLTLSGIWTYIFYGAHEGEHHSAFTDGTYLIDTNQPTKPWRLAFNGTHLVSTWEDNHYFDSTSNNTTNSPPYSNETDAPDDEVVADIIGVGGLLDNLADWQQDWAGAGTLADGSNCDGGLQYGTSHLAKAPSATIYTPYFTFTPATQNPDKSWSYGAPVKIWSRADLQAVVPGLMTSLLAYPNRP